MSQCSFPSNHLTQLAVISRVAPLLISRFILDLRGVFYSNDTQRTDLPTMHFATVLGDLSAPLQDSNSTWTTGAGDDVGNELFNVHEELDRPFRISPDTESSTLDTHLELMRFVRLFI